MDSFLQHIAKNYKVENHNSLMDTCFVFPSKRASLYFSEILKNENRETAFWAPATLSIEEFVQELNPEIVVADTLELMLLLYSVYQKHGGSDQFEEFYTWGSVLLKDFDEIDRYIVEGELIYKNLQEVENLEATFGPSEELLKALQSFKKVIDDGKDGALTSNFTENWSLIGKIYTDFRQLLSEKGKAYIGGLYRNLADRIKTDFADIGYKEVVFAGFNALSKSEEVIIDTLANQGIAKLFFDADNYYFRDDKEEAGYFLRKNKRRWYKHPQVEWVIADGYNSSKNIEVIGVEQQVAQTRAATEIIEDYGLESTAIVMGDESLITSMIYSLPESGSDVNITMGFPVATTSLANLTRAFYRFQETISVSKAGKFFLNREAYIALLNQPALGSFEKNNLKSLEQGKSSFIPFDFLADILKQSEERERSLLSLLFLPATNILGATNNLIEYFSAEYYFHKEDKSNAILETGVRHSLLRYLKSLKTQLEESVVPISYRILDKILRESLKQLSTPFSGEPLAKLQVMGFLESRALDFRNLVLLSVNEDTIPAGSSTNSYIPFNIRKAFGLPTFLEQNSIYAYHFFRLLQRAENISLIYSTQLSVTGAGEQSRFIYQLIEKAKQINSDLKIKRKIWSPAVPKVTSDSLKIEILKIGENKVALDKHLESFSDGKFLTPTQLVDYITCPLKYFYARILKIKDRDPETAIIDARIFGNLLHEVLESFYTPFIGKEVTKEMLTSKIKQLPSILDTVFQDYDKTSGEIDFTRNVIQNLAEKMLKNDLDNTPIQIHDLESKSKPLKVILKVSDSVSVQMGGLIDRLDSIEVDGTPVHRVLDYKTGRAILSPTVYYSKPVSDEDYVESHFTDPKFKSGFQLLFYILVLKKINPEWQLNGGIIGIRKVNKGIDYLRNSATAINPIIIDRFEEELKKLITEIADPEVPFRQTNDIKRCEYCQFKRICSR